MNTELLQKLSNKISTTLQEYADEWHVKLDEATKTITCSWSGYKPAIIISWEDDWQINDDFIITCDNVSIDILYDVVACVKES